MKQIYYLFLGGVFFYSQHVYNAEQLKPIVILTSSDLNQDIGRYPFGFGGIEIDTIFAYVDHSLDLVLHKKYLDKFIPIERLHVDCNYGSPVLQQNRTALPYENDSYWCELVYWSNRKKFFFWGPFFEKRFAVGMLTSTDVVTLGMFNNDSSRFYNLILYHYVDYTGKKYHKTCYVSYGKHGCYPLYFDRDKYFALLLVTFFPSRVVWDKKIFYTEAYTYDMLQ